MLEDAIVVQQLSLQAYMPNGVCHSDLVSMSSEKGKYTIHTSVLQMIVCFINSFLCLQKNVSF